MIKKLLAINRGVEMPTNKVKISTRSKQLAVQVFLRFNSDEKLFFLTELYLSGRTYH